MLCCRCPHSDLELGKFTVKLNHRRLLDAMLAIAGVPAQKFRPICRSVHDDGPAGWPFSIEGAPTPKNLQSMLCCVEQAV
jgi:hypothetical protein